jgi:hypothetical protein
MTARKKKILRWRRIRTSVEWPYETATNLFHILQSKYNKHLLGHNRTPIVLIGQQLHVFFIIIMPV